MMLSDVCLSDVCRVHPVGGRRVRPAGRPAGWMARLADRARLGRPGSRLPMRASVADLSGGISWRPPAYSLFRLQYSNAEQIGLTQNSRSAVELQSNGSRTVMDSRSNRSHTEVESLL